MLTNRIIEAGNQMTNNLLNKDYIELRINELFDLSFNFTYNNTDKEELKSQMLFARSKFNYDDKVSFIQDFFDCGILEILDNVNNAQDFVERTVKELARILIFICSLDVDKFAAYHRKNEGSVV